MDEIAFNTLLIICDHKDCLDINKNKPCFKCVICKKIIYNSSKKDS